MTPELWTGLAMAVISLFSAIGGGIVSQLIKLPLEKKQVAANVLKTKADVAANVLKTKADVALLDAERQKLATSEYGEIIKELRQHIDDLKGRIDDLEQSREADAILLKDALDQVAALTESNEALLKERGEMALKIIDLETKNRDFGIRLRQTEQELRGANVSNQKLSEQVKQLGKLEKRVCVLEAENKKLKAERDELLKRSK